jgi:hypothetical protein
MTHAHRRHSMFMTTILAVALAVGACGPGAATTTPSGSATPSVAPTAVATTAPTVAPSSTPSSVASASTATACTHLPQTTTLPSDRFTDLKVASGATSDRLTFVFGNASMPGPTATPTGTLDAATPPYTQAGSGAAIVMTGDHVLQLRFTSMSLQNDAGEETYTGPASVKPDLPALRRAVLYDESEGVIGWYIGYDGTGCVTLGTDGGNVIVTIDHS